MPAGHDSIRETRAAFDSWGWVDTVVVILLTLAALAVRLHRLDYRGMWTDEFHTLGAVLLPWGEMVRERMLAGHLPTYFLLMKWWAGITGTTDWALRFPSAVTGALIVPAAAFFARRFVSRRFLAVLLGIACINGTVVWASQEARMYGMLCVAATLAHWLYLRTLLERGWKPWAAYYLALLVAVSLQPVMFLAYFGHLAFSYRVRRTYPEHSKAAFRTALALLVVVLPLAIAFGGYQQKRSISLDISGVKDLFRDLARNVSTLWKRTGLIAFGSAADTGWWRIATGTALIGCLVGLRLDWKRPDDTPASGASDHAGRLFLRFCLAATIVPVAIVYFASLFVEHLIGVERYLIPITVPLWVLGIRGVVGLRGRWRDAMVVVCCALMIGGLVRQWADRGLGGREVVYHINRRALRDDAIICRASPTMTLMVKHYSARNLNLCAVPEALSDGEAFEQLFECVEGNSRLWLVEYRGKGQRLNKLLFAHPDVFELLKEIEIGSAKALLIRIKHP